MIPTSHCARHPRSPPPHHGTVSQPRRRAPHTPGANARGPRCVRAGNRKIDWGTTEFKPSLASLAWQDAGAMEGCWGEWGGETDDDPLKMAPNAMIPRSCDPDHHRSRTTGFSPARRLARYPPADRHVHRSTRRAG